MRKGIEAVALLVICCEGISKNLTEENYYKQLHTYVSANNPKFIKFNEIRIIKVKINDILNINKLITTLDARGIKCKYSYVAIWKDNDNQSHIQEQNSRIYDSTERLFKKLKKYLIKNKKVEENFGIWILPKGWNFETYYRKHFSKKLIIGDRRLKEQFKEPDHFLKKVFTEENFRNINLNLKKHESSINLFDFGEA